MVEVGVRNGVPKSNQWISIKPPVGPVAHNRLPVWLVRHP